MRDRPAAPTAGGVPRDERAADLARFLVTAREQSTKPPPARGRRGAAGRSVSRTAGAPRASGIDRQVVAVVGVLAVVTVVLLTRLAGHGGAAAGEPAGVSSAAHPTAVMTSAPTGAPEPEPPTNPPGTATRAAGTSAGAPGSSVPSFRSPPEMSATATPVTTRDVAVTALPGPPSWRDVVTGLFDRRASAFARGRPDLLTTADAAGSPLLHADQLLFARVVLEAGFQRVEGLGFELSGVQPLSVGPSAARIVVTGRQGPAVLIGFSGRRALAAGPTRTVVLELRRLPASADWRLQASSAPS